MANDESAFREVDEALEEERQWAFFRKNGPALIAGAVLLVAGVAGWQGWSHMKTREAERQAIEFRDAVDLLATDATAGRAALEKVSAEKGGYGALASLRRANSYANGGERLKAIETYREVVNSDAPRRLREFAQLRAAILSLSDGRDAVMSDLGNLAESEGPYSYHAKEILGLASLHEKDYESAVATFNALSLDIAAPEGVRDRATEFAALAEEAKAGVNITGELKVEDLLSTVGAQTESDAPAQDGAGQDGADEAAATQDGASEEDGDMPEETAANAAETDHDDQNHEE